MTELALELEKRAGIPLEEWSKLSMVDVGLRLTSGIEIVNPNPQQIYYRVTDRAALLLVQQATYSVDAFEAARKVVAANVWNSAPLPIKLRAFAVGMLNGTVPRPKQQGGGNTNLFVRWQIYSGCKTAHEMFGLPLVRKDHEPEESAADLMANLASEFDHPFKFNTVRDWLKHKNYTVFRKRCDAATDYMRDKYLFDLGVKRQRP
ncbi:hypothetical protein [Sulfitobacter sp. EhC04]|uniref:hypothetical protein n=1 Tax=Sulfitobacter sp. EhC04 TaxID=1849168 RepID=UPI0010FD4357|nr:hypothetical protein [Sulfitobacter sp. EhC04]